MGDTPVQLTPFEQARLNAHIFCSRMALLSAMQEIINVEDSAIAERLDAITNGDTIMRDILEDELKKIDMQIVDIANGLERVGISA